MRSSAEPVIGSDVRRRARVQSGLVALVGWTVLVSGAVLFLGLILIAAGGWQFVNAPVRTAAEIAVFALAFTFAGAWTIATASKLRHPPTTPGRCRNCGYDLRAARGTHCAECGLER